ncbi:hypothetical protein GRF29_185g600646 [Pseudopithomyces chartarum]|uniref:Uncharacterized protein n=1 Tax=Pseudopithomyces chartarum TaxID=1892770 RepID=A0AAN6RBV7_9PLEO|nr:hypothetical protein GRF29_185g600646 [Pseudopithomyces chartarum]
MKTFSVASVALLVSPFLVAVTATPLRSADAAEIGDNEKRADCWIKADWYGNWPSGGFRRYGVRLTAGPDGRRKDLLDLFCAITQGNGYANINNKACWAEPDGSYKVDITTFEGSHGHDLYLDFHQQNFNSWRGTTNCDVDNRNM